MCLVTAGFLGFSGGINVIWQRSHGRRISLAVISYIELPQTHIEHIHIVQINRCCHVECSDKRIPVAVSLRIERSIRNDHILQEGFKSFYIFLLPFFFFCHIRSLVVNVFQDLRCVNHLNTHKGNTQFDVVG